MGILCMNMNNVVPSPYAPEDTTPLTTNSVWAWEHIVQGEQQKRFAPNQLSKNLPLPENYYFSDTIEFSKQDPIVFSVWNELQPTKTALIAQPFKIAGFPILKNVMDFAENNGLCDYLQFAIDCLRSSFSSQAQFIIIKDTDPEINEEWINIGIQEEGNVQDIINKYDHIIDLWVQHVPWPQRSMIRFSF